MQNECIDDDAAETAAAYHGRARVSNDDGAEASCTLLVSKSKHAARRLDHR